jgi:hypothetical protein
MHTGEQLVRHHAEREEIGSCCRGCDGELLGGHVGRGADHRSRPRDMRRRELPRVGGVGLGRDTKVEDLHDAVAREEQIFGFDVAVNDAAFVRRAKAARNLREDVERAGIGPPAIASRNVSPSSSSVTAYATEPSRPTSWSARMLG